MELYKVTTTLYQETYVLANSYADAEQLFKSRYRENYNIEKIECLGPVLQRR